MLTVIAVSLGVDEVFHLLEGTGRGAWGLGKKEKSGFFLPKPQAPSPTPQAQCNFYPRPQAPFSDASTRATHKKRVKEAHVIDFLFHFEPGAAHAVAHIV